MHLPDRDARGCHAGGCRISAWLPGSDLLPLAEQNLW